MNSRHLAGLALAGIVVAGCGGGGGGGGTTPPVNTTVSYSIEWAARARTAGPASALSVTMTLRNSQGQTVLTDARDRNAAPGAYTQTYTTTNQVPTGNYTLTFTFFAAASGGGDVVAQGSQNVAVGSSGVVPSISTSRTISSVTVEAGQQVQVGQTKELVFTARTSGGQPVALSPGSERYSVVSGGTNLAVAAAGAGVTGLQAGNATVRVSVDGIASATTPVSVVGVGETVTLQVPNRTILFAASQDGTGDWEPVTPNGSTLAQQVGDSSGRFGFAVVTRDSTETVEVYVIHATLAETKTLAIPSPTPAAELRAMTGSVTNLPVDRSLLLYGHLDSVGTVTANGNYSVELSRKTGWDLLAFLQDGEGLNTRIGVRRNLSALPRNNVNFDTNTDLVEPATGTLSVSGPGAEGATLLAQLITSRETSATLVAGGGPSLNYPALPVPLQDSGDRYRLSALTFGDTWFNQVDVTESVPGNRALVALAPMAEPAVTQVGQTAEVAGTAVAEAKLYQFSLGGDVRYECFATAGWLGNASSYTYASPPFLLIPEWNAAWNLGTLRSWDVYAYSNNGSVNDLFDYFAPRNEGYSYRAFVRSGLNGSGLTRADRRRLKGLPGAPIWGKKL